MAMLCASRVIQIVFQGLALPVLHSGSKALEVKGAFRRVSVIFKALPKL